MPAHASARTRSVMSVNMSLRQFKDPALLDDIADVLAETGLAPSWLEIEITESMIMHNVDLVVACDSAVAHLAGALGVPVWVPLPMWCDWRWMLGRSDTLGIVDAPIRQTKFGSWKESFAAMAEALK